MAMRTGLCGYGRRGRAAGAPAAGSDRAQRAAAPRGRRRLRRRRRRDVDGRRLAVDDAARGDRRADRQRRRHRRRGATGPPLLFVHGLSGLWQNWLLNIPAFMGDAPLRRARPARLRRVRDAAREDLDQGLRETLERSATASASSRPGRDRQLDGRLRRPPSSRSRSRRASTSSCSSRPPAWRSSTSAAGRRSSRASVFTAVTARTGARATEPVVRRPRLRRAVPPGRRALPGAPVRPAHLGARPGRGEAGLHPRARGADELLLPRPARARSRCRR